MKKVLGLGVMLSGALMVLVQAAWTTAENREVAVLPPWAANALVFMLGLTGLVLIYAGYRLLRDK
jgi:hypothetical protein